jgi:hypothetical protein
MYYSVTLPASVQKYGRDFTRKMKATGMMKKQLISIQNVIKPLYLIHPLTMSVHNPPRHFLNVFK